MTDTNMLANIMKNNFILLIVLIIVSCSSSKNVTEKRCKSILKNDYNNIREDNIQTIVSNDTIILNEVKYKCVFKSVYTKKVMYDKFGKWNQEIYLNERSVPILLWENVKLFPNDTTEFNIAANGLENVETIYSSIIIFDKQNNDLLSENSKYKLKLIQYFSEMIKSNDTEKKDFYEVYGELLTQKFSRL
jgi:hypothetical protein